MKQTTKAVRMALQKHASDVESLVRYLQRPRRRQDLALTITAAFALGFEEGRATEKQAHRMGPPAEIHAGRISPAPEIRVWNEPCGVCGGTGEVACSSTSYMPCPACGRRQR